MTRLEHLKRFYSLMEKLSQVTGAPRTLSDCSGRMPWAKRGVYFFMEEGEGRSDSGAGPRIVRVGTHALTNGSRSTLWQRLSQHRGQARDGGGNHRGSIFRMIVGTALIKRHSHVTPTWGKGSSAKSDIRAAELAIEREVSQIIRGMPFLTLTIEDEPGAESERGFIERNAIALLSNLGKALLDPPSDAWLGRDCDRPRVRESGLWNQNHVNEDYDPAFLDSLDRLIREAEPST